jgi:hypothetical protein
MTLLGGSMVADPANGKFIDTAVRRRDWLLWRSARKRLQIQGSRLPAFGDYGTMRPNYELPDFPRAGQPYISYTSWRMWLLFKERAVESNSRSLAYKRMCERLIATPQYRRCGPLFSNADGEIDRIVHRTATAKKFGAAAYWVQMMTNHHLHFVAMQLAFLP